MLEQSNFLVLCQVPSEHLLMPVMILSVQKSLF